KVVTLYFQLFEALFPDMIDRQKEIQRLTEGKYPGLGYYNLADLMKRKAFNVVMTTNFDDLVHDALLYSGQNKRARVISHHHLAQYIDRGETPHIVKLHGDAHLHPFNDKENTQEIEESLANSVQTLLANTKLIVIGYGGGDKSIAKLLESVSRQAMVYWCNKETPEKTELEEWWNSLPHKQHVEEFDFDKIMNAFGDKFKLKAPDFNKFATQLKSQYDESFKKETQEAIENNDIDELQKLISQSLRSGEYEKGIELALKAKELIEGEEDNAEMLVDINNTIGRFYIHLAKYDKAIELLEETLTIELGENHPGTATSYNNIGSVWKSKGEYDKAIEYCEKALKIRLATLGENHPSTATSYNNIGSAWNSKGEYDKAIEYYEKALKITCATLEENHPFTATSYNNIGLAWKSKGEYDEAMKYHEKALKIKLATLGENHPDTATSYNNIGSVWKSKGEYDKAIEYCEKALTILGKVYPDGHPDIETVEKNLKSAKESLDNTD
ncbi:MAG: tetratricopeptide repeat protein, partial [Sulfurovum sp.]|nr:tetratricopeptide repeat protein [Sulfurovum sp.]